MTLPSNICSLCGNPISGKPVVYSELVFDSEKCKTTYQKLASVYGHNISDAGLPDVLNANFFFVDVVGLSDPSLSVKRQMTKIEALNGLVGSCNSFMTSKKNKIALPTGDGMAIGFLLDPELPLQLSIEFHEKLRKYNEGKPEEEKIGVRIGLSSGTVFVLNDINNNKNLWGPGLVLARRVMDLGDDLHILMTGKMAEDLIALRDEYSDVIKPISEFEIKHGQKIKLYSVYSADFGNPNVPEKVRKYLAEHSK